MIEICLNLDQMGYFLSLLDPDVIVNTDEGILVGQEPVLWIWNAMTQLWCWK